MTLCFRRNQTRNVREGKKINNQSYENSLVTISSIIKIAYEIFLLTESFRI